MSDSTSLGVRFPEGWRVEILAKSHKRRDFKSGQTEVDVWFQSSALQSQSKHLSVTKVLLDDCGAIVGFYTLATSQVDFSDLPWSITKKLPQRQLPVAVIAWFGINQSFQAKGLGKRMLATALRDCYNASQTFAFVSVLLDCVSDSAKDFYLQFDFQELPGYPMRLFLAAESLRAMVE